MSLLPIGTRLIPLGIKSLSHGATFTLSFHPILGTESQPMVITGYSKSKHRYLTNLDNSHNHHVFRDCRGIAVERVGVVEEYKCPPDFDYYILVTPEGIEEGFTKLNNAMQARINQMIEETQAYLVSLQSGVAKLRDISSEVIDDIPREKISNHSDNSLL